MGSKKKKKALRRQQKAEQKALANNSTQQKTTKAENRKRWMVLLLILVFSFICYSPNLNNGFVNWDDDRNFLENELITSLNNENFWENTVEIFKTDVIGGYNPLTVWTFLLEYKYFGFENPGAWHTNNILLHLICCMFVFWCGFRLRLGIWGTSILTLLFAIHPMRVESVAWVTERKDVLYGAFYMAALFYYIKGKQDGFRKRDILIIAVCFFLSLLSKIQAVILPVSMVLVDYYLSSDARIQIKSILKKWPYFIGSLATGLIGIYFLKDQGSTDQVYTGISRLFIGGFSLMVYYVKSIVPYKMSPLYPYPSSLEWYFYPSILSLFGSVYLLWISYKKKWKQVFFGLAFFLANVVLLLQILGAGQGFLADRFTYIPYLGLFFIYAYYLERLIKNNAKFKSAAKLLSIAAVAVYSVMCYNQNKIWENSATLWTHVIKHYSNTALPWGNRANYYRASGQTQKALNDYSQVIRLKPNKPEAYNSRARLYFNFTHRDSLLKALDNYNRAIALKPNDAEYLVNRGATYAKLNDVENALINLNEAEKVDPNFANIYLNRLIIHNHLREWDKALRDADTYIKLRPYDSDMWYEKSRLHMILKQYDQWLAASNKAISMMPNNGLYHYERARAYNNFKYYPEAKASLQKALSLGYDKGTPQFIDLIMSR